jgi:hypothetical protein
MNMRKIFNAKTQRRKDLPRVAQMTQSGEHTRLHVCSTKKFFLTFVSFYAIFCT